MSCLINKGYKRIAYFRGDLNPQNSIDRFIGYKKALLDNNLEFDSSLVYMCADNDFDNGYLNAKKVVEDHKSNPIDAIYTITDLAAIGAINYLNEKQIKIPEDVAIFGFSNWFMSSVITPTLSSVDQKCFYNGRNIC